MLGIWLGMALVNISGYQPVAEQTWVQLSSDYYPLARTPPAMFVAWRGNQLPPLAQKKQGGHWQLLFPVRLEPPFDLFEGEAQLSKAYLARLRRIDEMAYGVAPHEAASVSPLTAAQPLDGEPPLPPFMAEFAAPQPVGRGNGVGETGVYGGEPWLAQLELAAYQAGSGLDGGEVPYAGEGGAQPLSASSRRSICHQVAAGETLWRIASQLSSSRGADTYSYLLALAEENRPQMGHTIRVKTGDRLYCPRAETLARFDALSPAQRQLQFAKLEQGRSL